MGESPNSPSPTTGKSKKKSEMFQTLENATALQISKARYENLVKAAVEGKIVAKTLRDAKELPIDMASEPVYHNTATGTKIYGVLEETAELEGTLFVVFMKNPLRGEMEAFVGFSKLWFSNFCGNGLVKATFVSSEGEEVLGELEAACAEYFFHGFKSAYADGSDEVAAAAAVAVFTAPRPGKAKEATNFHSGLKIKKEWDEVASEAVMRGAVLSQLGYEGYFTRLFQVAEFCEKKEGVSADRVHIIEATDDGTWGWGGPRKAPKLAEGEEVTEAYLAAKMPLMMGGEVAVFQAEGGVEFKGGKNKLGKILTEAMRATVAHKGDHTAFVAGAGALALKVVVVESKRAAGEVVVGSPKRAAGEGAEEERETKRACSPVAEAVGEEVAVGRTLSYVN